jgi:hypothetical protein
MNSTRTSDSIGASDRRHVGRAAHHGPSHGLARQAPMEAEPRVCRTCGAVSRGGRWQWLPLPERQEARLTRCPACLRIRDDDPAGSVTLVGGFVRLRAEELSRLIRYHEEMQKRGDPQSRIVRVRRLLDRIDVTTTDAELPRWIGEAVAQAYGGTLHIMPENEGSGIRVRWLDDEAGSVMQWETGLQARRRAACTSTRSQRMTTVRWPSTTRSARRPSPG